uniref:H15 domain-containing protein n=1 Tax=Caenorhabditis tropicalis TaxID=1561998 RepID=A0A1I7T843_9PELO
MLLHDHVASLTNIISFLKQALLASSAKTVVEKVNAVVPEVPAMPDPAKPLPLPYTAQTTAIQFPTNNATNTLSIASSKNKTTSADPFDIAKKAATLLDKSSRAVIERMTDNPADPSQDNNQFTFFQALATRHNLPAPTKIHRHQCQSKFRPLKVQFNSSIERDLFIRGFNNAMKSEDTLNKMSPKPRIRRDLTTEELEKLRESRKFVYEENLKAGVSLYLMDDISYKKNTKPRPKKKKNSPRR